jgi:hypothetical protein
VLKLAPFAQHPTGERVFLPAMLVPTLGAWCLALLALLLMGINLARRRQHT